MHIVHIGTSKSQLNIKELVTSSIRKAIWRQISRASCSNEVQVKKRSFFFKKLILYKHDIEHSQFSAEKSQKFLLHKSLAIGVT